MSNTEQILGRSPDAEPKPHVEILDDGTVIAYKTAADRAEIMTELNKPEARN